MALPLVLVLWGMFQLYYNSEVLRQEAYRARKLLSSLLDRYVAEYVEGCAPPAAACLSSLLFSPRRLPVFSPPRPDTLTLTGEMWVSSARRNPTTACCMWQQGFEFGGSAGGCPAVLGLPLK